MGHKYTREQILAGALDAALDEGISQLTFGRLGKRLGVSDRVIVYYFPTKNELISSILVEVGGQLQESLAEAFTSTAAGHVELLRSAWPVLAHHDVDPIFALFFESLGLAIAGREPYQDLARQLVEAWIVWLTEFISGTEEQRHVEAEAAVAVLDGLLLIRQVSGPDVANRAAHRLGIC